MGRTIITVARSDSLRDRSLVQDVVDPVNVRLHRVHQLKDITRLQNSTYLVGIGRRARVRKERWRPRGGIKDVWSGIRDRTSILNLHSSQLD